MLPKFDPTNTEACLSLIEDVTTNLKQIQDSVLEAILSRNAETEYLKGLLNGQVDKHTFKKNVPIVTYEDYRSYIDRIANGEPHDLICEQPIDVLVSSSGTSAGFRKLFPITREDLENRMLCGSLWGSLVHKHIKGLSEGKFLKFWFVNQGSETVSGLKIRTVITCFLNRQNQINSSFWDRQMTSSLAVSLCDDTTQSMYCQLLCGLAERGNVVRIGAPFASSFLKVIKFLENHWRELCSNIRTGRLSDWITDAQCISETSKFLFSPNSELASLIEQECSKPSWDTIVRRLWPNAKCIEAIVTGAMAQYISMLEFYGGGLPLISPAYVCSECYLGLNLNPLCKPCDVSYTIIPNMGYFEFLEVTNKHQEAIGLDHEENPRVVDLIDVKIDHDYELVITNFSGLYRHRVGDVIRVVGFYNNAPQFHFVGRHKVVLSIDMDKTYEEDLHKAVANAKLLLEPHDLMLMDFTSRVDTSLFPGHYVLYWELGRKTKNANLEPNGNALEECCFIIEESLNSTYRKGRKNDEIIGPLEIKVVRSETFDKLMNFFLSQGSSLSQYKTPTSVTREEALKILEANIVSNFFSRKTPSWEPREMDSSCKTAFSET